jgi:hypothetical protein
MNFTIRTDCGAMWPGVYRDDSVEQVFTSAVDEESFVVQQVHDNDGYLHDRHHESRSEITEHSHVQAPAVPSKYGL